MLDQETIDRLRELDADGHPVLSVYVGLRPEVGTLRELPARLKDLLDPLTETTESMAREDRMSLREDVRAVLGMTGRIAEDLGRGVAIFRCHAAGIDEYVSLPAPVRDRAIVESTPYLRPLEAMLSHLRRYGVVVVDRRKADIFRFYQGELEAWEEMAEEEIRKDNFAGWYGLEEHRVRNHADEVLQRHYRAVAARLAELWRSDDGFDLLIVGGHREHVDGLLEHLHPELRPLVAGTFTIDPRTMTPAMVEEAAEGVAAEWERRVAKEEVERLLDTARSGGEAVLGLAEVVPRVNQRAVDLLVVQAQTTRPGYRCRGCGYLALEADGVCPVCGGAMEQVPDVIDAVTEAVVAAGGSVHHVLGETDLAPYEVGAFLRFNIPTELTR